MRAKFEVISITTTTWGEEANMQAVHSGTPEDNQFSEATPSGKLTMTITAKPARGFLTPGKKYYLDFSPAE